MELDPERLTALQKHVQELYPEKLGKVHFITGDCNEELLSVIAQITVYHRCLMFLDPYALELKWETLKKISECPGVDLWYLFPLAAIRLMAKDKNITDGNKEKVTSILGTDEWLEDLYEESQQVSLFEEPQYERIEYARVLDYIKSRIATIFSYVSPHSKILKNEAKNAPMFMLCFMMTNKSSKAQALASKLVKAIINSAEKI